MWMSKIQKRGMTVLMEAVKVKHLGVVQLLLKAGANTRLRNSKEKTALDIAINMGAHKIAQLLR